MDTQTASPADAVPLFGAWTLVERVVDTVSADGVELRRAGLTAQRTDGAVVTGSAASPCEDPLERARFELLERAAIVDAMAEGAARTRYDEAGRRVGRVQLSTVFPSSPDPSRTRNALSSGVAIGPDLAWARERARLELVERDQLLRAWYGELSVIPLPIPVERVPATESYDWRAVTFAGSSHAEPVVAVFALPRTPSAPLLRGFAARSTVDAALDAAIAEALQGLAFLWAEAIPTEAPPSTSTPMFHLDHYLWPGSHAILGDWLARGHTRFACEAPKTVRAAATTYFDLTPGPLRRLVRVVQAAQPGAARLVFGFDPAAAHLPSERRVHPIS